MPPRVSHIAISSTIQALDEGKGRRELQSAGATLLASSAAWCPSKAAPRFEPAASPTSRRQAKARNSSASAARCSYAPPFKRKTPLL
jgi:hypothetical protein